MELEDGANLEVRGSSGSVYELRNVGGVYSCTCPAWRNQGRPAHSRSCKHLRNLRGEEAERLRLEATGLAAPLPAARPSKAGESTDAPVLLAHPWDQLTDLTGWWMSEKLDGVRAYWDGKRLVSRLGNPFVAPSWFLERLPDRPLDGELWGGRKRFQRTVSIVRRQDASDEWRQIQYVVFDAPEVIAPFEERLETCRWWLRDAAEHCRVLDHYLCQGVEHLRQELSRVEAQGGEGLMLRKPGSAYEVGRSWSLLKVKSFHDAEALVVGHQAGEGRHKGRLGALLVQLPEGTKFSVGTGFTDRERDEPPPIGATITFRYQELSDGGVPRFPSYVGERIDAPRILPVKKKETLPMNVVQTGLLEACDLHSQNAQERLGLLLNALHAYSNGSRHGLLDYAEKYPFTRLKDLPGDPPPPPASKPAAPTPAPATSGFRRFEFHEGGSSKFWEVALDGSHQTVKFGRIGTAGQSKTKSFASEAEAKKDTDKLIAEKTGKGYAEV